MRRTKNKGRKIKDFLFFGGWLIITMEVLCGLRGEDNEYNIIRMGRYHQHEDC